jgi:hypothetical protein
LRKLCEKLDWWHTEIEKIWNYRFHSTKLHYPAYDFSTNWESNTVVYKNLQKWDYHRPVALLYRRLKNDPYLKIINQWIPD